MVSEAIWFVLWQRFKQELWLERFLQLVEQDQPEELGEKEEELTR